MREDGKPCGEGGVDGPANEEAEDVEHEEEDAEDTDDGSSVGGSGTRDEWPLAVAEADLKGKSCLVEVEAAIWICRVSSFTDRRS